MRFLLTSLFILSTVSAWSAKAQEEIVEFRNVREGESFYDSSSDRQSIKKALRVSTKEELVSIFRESLQKQNKKSLCSYHLNDELNHSLEGKGLNVDLKGLILVARQENEIDDVVASVLLKAHEVKSTKIYYPKSKEDYIYPEDSEAVTSQLTHITNFEKKMSKASCLDEAYKSLYSDMAKNDKKLKDSTLDVLFFKAREDKVISNETYLLLQKSRLNKLEQTGISLSSYLQKIKTLRLQYPLRDPNEKSDFVSIKVKKTQMSRRQKLFEYYTDLQIIMMGNVIKKLRSRLEYDAVEISGFKAGVLQETIPLDPMERFRFAIKLLRKEMSLLSLNSYFNGRAPEYMDLMVASYEIGIIPASELDSVASLEEIWSPKKTLWEKAGVWVRTFSSVVTLVIPPPYGFIPALVLVVIEATTQKKADTNNDPTVLF